MACFVLIVCSARKEVLIKKKLKIYNRSLYMDLFYFDYFVRPVNGYCSILICYNKEQFDG